MSALKRKNKPVYFSKDDPVELEMLKYVEKINPLTGRPQNFSKYIKRLISQDLNREKYGVQPVANVPVTVQEEITDETKMAMSSFL